MGWEMTWFADRFTEDADRLRFDCIRCSRPMWFPRSKHGKYQTCGGECAEAVRQDARGARMRSCIACGAPFLARSTQLKSGGAKYCSQKCTESLLALGRTPEVTVKRTQARKLSFLAGKWIGLRGAANARWKGGRDAYIERQRLKDPTERAAKRRAYLRANPEKAREWRAKRRGLGRLPRGTVTRLMSLQRGRCACCSRSIRQGFHLDHIMPLHRGGEHAPHNLQLLCGPCNLRKSAKHPVDFMQSLGFLL
jgi:5-methylcytosine-specific restriction endonuclease McrA